MASAPHDPRLPVVAFLIDRWDPSRGGAERALARFAEHLTARGHGVLAVAEEHAAGAPGEPVKSASFGFTRAGRERSRARALVRAARRAGADVTIGCRHLFECDLYWPHGGVHAVTMSQRALARGKLVDGPLSGRHAQFAAFERALTEGHGARRIVCVSQAVRDEFAVEWPASRERLVVIENGVDLQRFTPERRVERGARLRSSLGCGPKTALIAFIGRNPELKGLPTLLTALSDLTRAGELDWRLATAGAATQRAAADAPLRERWTECEPIDVAELLAAADILAHPTWRDTSGLVILEALASGVPVVTTRCAGAAGRVGAEAGVVLERPGDAVQLSRALAAWFGRVRAGALDRAAIRAHVADLELSRCHAALERLVNELARERGGASL